MNNRGGEGKRLGLPDIDDGFLLRLCEHAAAIGGVVCPHPENIEASWVLRDRLMAADPDGRGGLAAWNASRPPFVEADAIQRVGMFARHTGARVHVVHVTSQQALDAALEQRRQGTDISIETCPHYLTHDVTWPGGIVAKINPPLREQADRDALWSGILSGDVDTDRDGSRASRFVGQGGRYLEGIAGLSRPRNAPAGDAQRGPSQARHCRCTRSLRCSARGRQPSWG